MLRRSQLNLLSEPSTFYWSTGIDDTFITASWPRTGRSLDEYELTDHYGCWENDLNLMASLGIKVARYGIPWHRLNPSPNHWDWSWIDRSMERLLTLDIEPIIDLVHYGLPKWIENAFLERDYPQRVAEYATKVATHFRGQIYAYTPLNEPRLTAWYCGKIGWWPPYGKSWYTFVQVLLQICRGIVLTCQSLQSVDPEIISVHADPADIYWSDDEALLPEAMHRQQLVFLALDLVSGHVTETHPLWLWLLAHGARDDELSWFLEQRIEPDILGLNMYPMFSNKRLVQSKRGSRIHMRYASPALLSQLVDLYWERYHRPLMITETAARGAVARRRRWLDGSVAEVKTIRERGIPLVGYTWWPMFGLIAWAYRQGSRPADAYVERMGLWDLVPASTPDGGFQRLHTPLVDAYRQYVASGYEHVGLLSQAKLVSAHKLPPHV
jgi:beta-glucosidase/6-phospho-beta-glucosidase/beta-galactosidase